MKAALKKEIAGYEATDDATIESLREEIGRMLEETDSLELAGKAADLEALLSDFRVRFNAFIAERHTSASRSHDVRDRTNEILASREWWVFENLAKIELFPQRFRLASRELLRELRMCNCTAQPASTSNGAPFCAVCGFSLKRKRRRDNLPDKFWKTVHGGLAEFESILRVQKDVLLSLSDSIGQSGGDAAFRDLSVSLSNGARIVDLSENELRALQTIIQRSLQEDSVGASIHETFTPVITGEIIEDAVLLQS